MTTQDKATSGRLQEDRGGEAAGQQSCPSTSTNELDAAIDAYAASASVQIQGEIDFAIRNAFLAGVRFGLNWAAPSSGAMEADL